MKMLRWPGVAGVPEGGGGTGTLLHHRIVIVGDVAEEFRWLGEGGRLIKMKRCLSSRPAVQLEKRAVHQVKLRRFRYGCDCVVVGMGAE